MFHQEQAPSPRNAEASSQTRWRRLEQRQAIIKGLLLGATMISCGSVLAILGFLFYFAVPILFEGHLAEIFSWKWRPFQGQFGILPMAVGSLGLAAAAMGVAYPLGLGICGFAHGLGPRCLKKPLMGLINFMTSIPTVIYGFVSVIFLVPLVRGAFPESTGYSWLTAALTLSLMILPTIVLLVQAQLQQVDARVRLASAALGFSPAQTLLWVMRPLASRGLWAAAVLGFSRALGDTIIALMVAGNAPQVPHSLLDSIRTLTSHIALVVATDSTSLAYQSIFASGLILFGVSIAVNLTLRRLQSRAVPQASERYD
ncbi:MAG: PstC family ABC transporter permease [Desulfobaccales bacterium]